MPTHLQTLSLSHLSRLRQQEFVERHALRVVFLGIVVLSLAGLLYLTQASAVTTTTYEIQELQDKKQRLQRKRDRLQGEIAGFTSPERIRSRAQALGFRMSPPDEFLTVTKTPVVAQRSPIITATQAPPSRLETLLTQTSHWLHTAVTLLPAPQKVEAGSANR